jgi:NTP pyrophosphatase (non-canonical NTP hydrolase)
MNLSEYQRAALRTAGLERATSLRVAVAGMGLAGEAAEVLEVVFSGDFAKLEKELGDVMWYVAETASSFGVDLGAVVVPDPDDDPDEYLEVLHRGYAVRLAIHAGMLTDYLKKLVGHGHEPDVDRVGKGLGLVLRDVMDLSGAAGYDLDEVCEANVRKLLARHPNGFTTAGSLLRADEG